MADELPSRGTDVPKGKISKPSEDEIRDAAHTPSVSEFQLKQSDDERKAAERKLQEANRTRRDHAPYPDNIVITSGVGAQPSHTIEILRESGEPLSVQAERAAGLPSKAQPGDHVLRKIEINPQAPARPGFYHSSHTIEQHHHHDNAPLQTAADAVTIGVLTAGAILVSGVAGAAIDHAHHERDAAAVRSTQEASASEVQTPFTTTRNADGTITLQGKQDTVNIADMANFPRDIGFLTSADTAGREPQRHVLRLPVEAARDYVFSAVDADNWLATVDGAPNSKTLALRMTGRNNPDDRRNYGLHGNGPGAPFRGSNGELLERPGFAIIEFLDKDGKVILSQDVSQFRTAIDWEPFLKAINELGAGLASSREAVAAVKEDIAGIQVSPQALPAPGSGSWLDLVKQGGVRPIAPQR